MSHLPYSQTTLHILCTLLLIYDGFCISFDTGVHIFNENEVNAIVQMRIPDFQEMLMRVSSDNGVYAMFIDQRRVTLVSSYDDIASAKVDNTIVSITYNNIMKLEYAQTFRCSWAFSGTPIDGCGFKVIVLAKPSLPRIKVADNTSVLLLGETVTLECVFESRTMPPNHGLEPSIKWTYGQHASPAGWDSRVIQLMNGSLVVKNIARGDLGSIFVCRAADDSGVDHKNVYSDPSPIFEVVVEYPPSLRDFTITPAIKNNSVIQIAENSGFRYECRVDCNPDCTVTWKKRPIQATEYITVVPMTDDPRVLVLTNVSKNDQGDFICEGSNKHGRNIVGFSLEIGSGFFSSSESSSIDLALIIGIVVVMVIVVIIAIIIATMFYLNIYKTRRDIEVNESTIPSVRSNDYRSVPTELVDEDGYDILHPKPPVQHTKEMTSQSVPADAGDGCDYEPMYQLLTPRDSQPAQIQPIRNGLETDKIVPVYPDECQNTTASTDPTDDTEYVEPRSVFRENSVESTTSQPGPVYENTEALTARASANRTSDAREYTEPSTPPSDYTNVLMTTNPTDPDDADNDLYVMPDAMP